MQRIEWIDICKAVAIFFMVFLHLGLELPFKCGWIDTAVHYWHMPLFIILSGVVLNTGKWCGWENFPKFLRSRTESLLIPLVAFGLVCLVFNAIFIFPDGVPAKNGNLWQSILYPNRYLYKYSIQWFLVCLFVVETIYVALYNLAGGRRLRVALLCTALPVAGHFLVQKTGMLPLTLDSAIYAVPMFALGSLGREMFTKWRPFRKWWAQILALAALTALFAFVHGKFNMRTCSYEPLWIYPFGIATTIAVIWLLREQEWWITKLRCCPAIQWLGKNTLAILVLNGSVRKVIPWRNLLASDNPLPVFSVQLLSTIVTLVIIRLISMLVLRYSPRMLGRQSTPNK